MDSRAGEEEGRARKERGGEEGNTDHYIKKKEGLIFTLR